MAFSDEEPALILPERRVAGIMFDAISALEYRV
jgi:hypothetical protein